MTPKNPYANKHVGCWGRHIVITVSLVVLVVFSLMWLNESLFSEQRATWQDYLSYYDQPVSTEAQVGSTFSKTSFNGFTITGVSAKVNLQDITQAQQQVAAVWTRFSQNEALHEAVSWAKGSNLVYAYYYNISSDFSHARVLVGYAMDKTIDGTSRIKVRAGESQRFDLGANGVAPQKAWEAVYPNGVLLEQYDLDMQGQTSNGYALVIN